MVLVVVAAVAFINLIASRKIVQNDFPGKISSFYGLSTLFVTGLMGVVITGDAFNLFVLLEITALTGYALIGMGTDHAPLASLNYIFMGTIGASFYLLGVGYLYLATGTLNMADLARLIPQMAGSKVILTAFIICLTGLYMKMALFPLHAWLPNAYTYAPSAAIGIIAPLTTKVMVYVLVRITLYVFTPEFSFARPMLESCHGLAGRNRHRGRIQPGAVAEKAEKSPGLYHRRRSRIYGGGAVAGQSQRYHRRDAAYRQRRGHDPVRFSGGRQHWIQIKKRQLWSVKGQFRKNALFDGGIGGRRAGHHRCAANVRFFQQMVS